MYVSLSWKLSFSLQLCLPVICTASQLEGMDISASAGNAKPCHGDDITNNTAESVLCVCILYMFY